MTALFAVIGFLINRSLIAVELNAGSTIWRSLYVNTRVHQIYYGRFAISRKNCIVNVHAGPTYPRIPVTGLRRKRSHTVPVSMIAIAYRSQLPAEFLLSKLEVL